MGIAMMFSKRSHFFIVAATLISPFALASSVLELMTTEYDKDPPVVGTVEISTMGKSSRIEITSVSSSESGGMIYNAERQEMIAIDHGAQEYYVIDQAMMNQMASQVSEAMKQMQEALAAMPPEQRALAEQMMKQQMPQPQVEAGVPVELKKTGKSDSLAGYDCDYYDVMQEGRRIREICMTGWDDIEEGREVAAAMMELAGFFESMRKAFAGAGGMGVMDRQQEMFTYMRDLNGYPILARDYDATGALKTESKLRSAGHVDLSAALFEPPESYRQQALQ
jgi:hypothetical protein